MKRITSRENPHFRQLRKLLDSSRERQATGLAVLEGAHLVRAALDAGEKLQQLFVADHEPRSPEVQNLLDSAPAAEVFGLAANLFSAASTADPFHGVIATLLVREPASLPAGSDWLVLDGVQDAGNVGTLMRTAAAAGIRDVILGPGCAQAWSPKVLRAGMGAHFGLRIQRSEDLCATLGAFAGRIAVTRLDHAENLYAIDLRDPVAWIFGAEGQGVSAPVAAMASMGVTIPMAPGIESLNVAAAAAICLFEQRRQRSVTASAQ